MSLTTTTPMVNLGNVPRGTIKEFTFNLTNNAIYPVSFTSTVSCGCTAPIYETQTMDQMSMQFPKVYLDTSKFGIGSFHKAINISFINMDSGEPIPDRLTISINGNTI
jgi:Protein of unknown function (DUF1573)